MLNNVAAESNAQNYNYLLSLERASLFLREHDALQGELVPPLEELLQHLLSFENNKIERYLFGEALG